MQKTIKTCDYCGKEIFSSHNNIIKVIISTRVGLELYSQELDFHNYDCLKGRFENDKK